MTGGRPTDALVADVRWALGNVRGTETFQTALAALAELARRAESADQRERAAVLEGERRIDVLDRQAAALREALEAALMDATVTYGIVSDDGSTSPMMVERAAIVRALGYENESAWLARTAEINAAPLPAPGMTDLMVTPESIDAALAAREETT